MTAAGPAQRQPRHPPAPPPRVQRHPTPPGIPVLREPSPDTAPTDLALRTRNAARADPGGGARTARKGVKPVTEAAATAAAK